MKNRELKLLAPNPLHSGECFIKYLRFDYLFNTEFFDGVTRTAIQKKPRSPRIHEHQEYTVRPDGVYKRSEKPTAYPGESYKKPWFSPHQSVSFIVKTRAELPVFGFNADNTNASVGVMIKKEDAMCNRYFLSDALTDGRPYEFDNQEEALEYYTSRINKTFFKNYEDFKIAVIKEKEFKGHNEVLARIRWNTESSAIGIFSDTNESRYVALIYAYKIKKCLQSKAGKLPEAWSDTYEVPIYYYTPRNKKNYQLYTSEEQVEDQKTANQILSNVTKREELFSNNQFACLL
jgi:hypothetical protein